MKLCYLAVMAAVLPLGRTRASLILDARDVVWTIPFSGAGTPIPAPAPAEEIAIPFSARRDGDPLPASRFDLDWDDYSRPTSPEPMKFHLSHPSPWLARISVALAVSLSLVLLIAGWRARTVRYASGAK